MIHAKTRGVGVVGLVALLVLSLAGCAGSKAEALPVVTDLRPNDHGWSFANYPASSFPDVQFGAADMASMFGDDPSVCIDGVVDPCTLTAEAASWAQMVNQSRSSGHCLGLAVIAARRFNENISPVTSTLASDESTLRTVMRAFASQFLPEAQAESEKWIGSSLSEIVEAVKTSLEKNQIKYTLGLFGPNGGHAISPFAVEYPSEGITRMMVYDSNWPGRNRYVDFDLKADTWTFSYSADDPQTDPEPWVGGSGDADLTSISFEKLTCPFCATDVAVKNSTFMIRTDQPEFSIETEEGTITADGTALPEGASVTKVKGAVGVTTFDYMVKIPIREDAAAARSQLRFPGTASVFAVLPSGIAQFQTTPQTKSPVVVSGNSVSSTDPTVSLKVAAGNLVASVSGSSTSLTLSDSGLDVAVTLPNGEIVQQEVNESKPALLAEVDPATGGVVVLQSTETGQVARTDIAPDGGRTESISTEPLNLTTVVPELPATLESKPNPTLPTPAARDLNNPDYKADTSYQPPVIEQQKPFSESSTTVPSAGVTPTTTAERTAPTPTTAPVSPNANDTARTEITRPGVMSTTSTTITTTTTLPRTTTTLPRTTITTTTTLPRTTTTVRRATITTTTTVPPTTTTTTTIPSPTYTVTYNGNSSTGGSVPSSRTSSSSFTVAANSGALVRAGYTFAGWNTAANGSGTTYTAGSSTLSMSANTTLYAQWTANTLTVTTDEQSGSAIDNVSTTVGASMSSPGTPTRSGYTFNGWFTASSGGSALTFPYTHNQTANFTLYAQWTESTPSDGSITAISSGMMHTCAVMDTGGVKCWGNNLYGQLGIGKESHNELPTKITGLSDVTAISAGGYFTCALLSTGGVKCWGANWSGGLGDGTTNSKVTPVNVLGLSSGVTALEAGFDHACALLSTGGVKCWGANWSGQLGDGTTDSRTTPTDVVGLSSGVSSISFGLMLGCAVMSSSGGVTCWGSNGYGQRGSNPGSTSTPTVVSGLSSGVVAVSTGYLNVCALLSTGGVKCWGGNSSGQLGDGTTTSRTDPTAVSGLSGVTAIDVGMYQHSCALLSTGVVSCWGANSYGQLGDGVNPLRSSPTDVFGLSSGVTALSAGRFASCGVLSSGGVKCWGNNGYGGLGVSSPRYHNKPVTPDGLGDNVYVATTQGWYHTCALLSTGGVTCWGSNGSGQLGDGTTDYRSTPTDVSSLSGVTAIASGDQHTCALLSTGYVKCWGSNSGYALGDGTTTDRSTPTDVSNLSGVTAISARSTGTCALLSTGAVKCWGNYSSTSRNISGLSGGAISISNGDQETCAVLSTGGVACWYNGDSSASVVSGLSSGVTAISVGSSHKCAILSTGAVKCYGTNLYAQLGDGTTTDRSTPIDVLGLSSGVTAISMGAEHSCALLSTGGVKCWGDNGQGLVGDGAGDRGADDIQVLRLAPSLPVLLNVPLRQLTCAAGGTCVVGDTGPGGGIVFYVHASGTFACGPTLASTCKYLEAAPTTGTNAWTYDSQYSYSPYRSDLIGANAQGSEIGSGYRNTVAMVNQGPLATNVQYAGAITRSYRGPQDLSDWYLPAKDELAQLLSNKLLLNIPSGSFVSSTEYSNDHVWRGYITASGYEINPDGKRWEMYVRPIRAFG